MHELGITRNIVAIVLEAAKGERVTRIALEVGKLAGVMADAVVFCFDVVAKDTPLEGAKLDVIEIPGLFRCRRCDREFAVDRLLGACPCGSRDTQLVRGDELMIKAIDIEEAA